MSTGVRPALALAVALAVAGCAAGQDQGDPLSPLPPVALVEVGPEVVLPDSRLVLLEVDEVEHALAALVDPDRTRPGEHVARAVRRLANSAPHRGEDGERTVMV